MVCVEWVGRVELRLSGEVEGLQLSGADGIDSLEASGMLLGSLKRL
jgi:hypothetical protein